jgi:hypothetical protein
LPPAAREPGRTAAAFVDRVRICADAAERRIPIYVMPALYGAAGTFLGVLIDSADRERAARR